MVLLVGVVVVGVVECYPLDPSRLDCPWARLVPQGRVGVATVLRQQVAECLGSVLSILVVLLPLLPRTGGRYSPATPSCPLLHPTLPISLV